LLPDWAANALIGTGVLLAGAAMFVNYKARQAEKRNPPHGEFIDVDGVRLHYVARGEGQPLVLLHGNGAMAQDYEISGLVDLAATRYRVIAFDRPGFGYSQRPRGRRFDPEAQADLLFKAMQQLGIDRPIVVGHSWGTLVAVALALQHPVYVRSLVLVSGYYYPTFRLDALLLSPPALPVIGDLLRHTVSPLFGRIMWRGLVRKVFAPLDVPPRFSRFPVWMALRPSQLRASAAEGALMIPATLAMKRRYRELIMPVVIVAGDSDRYVDTRAQSVRLHEDLPRSELRLVPGAGHMVHQVAPRQVMAAVESVANAF
jgi:pimeloyl-ACP methyl ester carboxylesterase